MPVSVADHHQRPMPYIALHFPWREAFVQEQRYNRAPQIMQSNGRQLCGTQQRRPPAGPQIVPVDQRAFFATENPAWELSRSVRSTWVLELSRPTPSSERRRRHHELVEPTILWEDFPALKQGHTNRQGSGLPINIAPFQRQRLA